MVQKNGGNKKRTKHRKKQNHRKTVKKDKKLLEKASIICFDPDALDLIHKHKMNKKRGYGGMTEKNMDIMYYPSFFSIYGKDNESAVPGLSAPVIRIENSKYGSVSEKLKSEMRKVDDFMALVTLQNNKMKYPKPLFTETVVLGDDSADDFTKRFNKQRYNFIINQKDSQDNLKWPLYLPKKSDETKIQDEIDTIDYAIKNIHNCNNQPSNNSVECKKLKNQKTILENKKKEVTQSLLKKFFSKTKSNLSQEEYRMNVCLYMLYMAFHKNDTNGVKYPTYIKPYSNYEYYNIIHTHIVANNFYTFNSLIINYFLKNVLNKPDVELINYNKPNDESYFNYTDEKYLDHAATGTVAAKNAAAATVDATAAAAAAGNVIIKTENLQNVVKHFVGFMENIKGSISSLIKEITKSEILVVETNQNIEEIKFHRYVIIFLKELLNEPFDKEQINNIEDTTNKIINTKKNNGVKQITPSKRK